MAEDDKVPDDKQCEAAASQKKRPRQRGPEALPGILGKQLRAAYGELLNAPVPDAITELIKRLEAQEAATPEGEGTQEPHGEEQSR